ncbi:MAG UNVERIFIED_CONTAM: hypothetical protein LVT10_20760 [Anaerolineae bacterium]
MSQLTPKQFEDQLNQRLPSETSRALVRCLLRLPTQWAQVNDRHTAQWLGQFFTLHPLPHDLEQLTFDQLVLQTLDAPTREQAGWFAHTLHQHQVTHFEERMLDVDWIPTLTTQRAFHGRRIVTSGGVVGFLYGGTLVGLAGLPFGFVLGTTIGLVGGLLFIALDRVVNRNQPLRTAKRHPCPVRLGRAGLVWGDGAAESHVVGGGAWFRFGGSGRGGMAT